ncbi:hypothetical protein AB4Z48_03315 [Cupriavidus sp. 2TAF22]
MEVLRLIPAVLPAAMAPAPYFTGGSPAPCYSGSRPGSLAGWLR